MMNKTKAEAAPAQAGSKAERKILRECGIVTQAHVATGAQVAQHTPGPWNLAPDGVVWDLLGGGNWIATIHNGYDEDESNARLIAAAPELLEALRGLYEYANAIRSPGILNVEMKAARAAIAKAEGRQS